MLFPFPVGDDGGNGAVDERLALGIEGAAFVEKYPDADHRDDDEYQRQSAEYEKKSAHAVFLQPRLIIIFIEGDENKNSMSLPIEPYFESWNRQKWKTRNMAR